MVVVIVLDGLTILEQRSLGTLMAHLRGELQPWQLSVKRPGCRAREGGEKDIYIYIYVHTHTHTYTRVRTHAHIFR